MTKQLRSRGISTSGLSGITFFKGGGIHAVSNGLLGSGLAFPNPASEIALRTGGVGAVTQGNLVFVNSSSWSGIALSPSAAHFEEIIHTRQFATMGDALFYGMYALSGAVQSARGYGSYDNYLEEDAKSLSANLSSQFANDKPC